MLKYLYLANVIIWGIIAIKNQGIEILPPLGAVLGWLVCFGYEIEKNLKNNK